MTTTPRELRRRIEDLQDDLATEYGREAPFCEIAHQELGVSQTPMPDEERESIQEQFRAHGVSLDDDSIKLTIEHREYHDAMRRVVLGLEGGASGDAVQLMSAGLAIGRRIGMSEAAAAFKGFEVD